MSANNQYWTKQKGWVKNSDSLIFIDLQFKKNNIDLEKSAIIRVEFSHVYSCL